jgi:hypothetical protein
MKRILALDPGGMTGWACADIALAPLSVEFTQGMLGPERHHLQLFNLLGHLQVQDFTIVTESFEYRNDSRPGLELVSREYIGVTELFVQERMRNGRPLVYQTASQGKIRSQGKDQGALVKMSNLKKLNLWFLGSGGERHMVDATGHLLYYMLTTKNVIPPELRMRLLRDGGWGR